MVDVRIAALPICLLKPYTSSKGAATHANSVSKSQRESEHLHVHKECSLASLLLWCKIGLLACRERCTKLLFHESGEVRKAIFLVGTRQYDLGLGKLG